MYWEKDRLHKQELIPLADSFFISDLQYTMPDSNLSDLPGSTETILVIDDDPSIRSLVDQVLHRYGYHLLLAEDGPQGLEIFQQTRVDIVLLDLSMPGMQGDEVLAKLKALSTQVKIILLTGFTEDEDELSGAHAIINKPFSIDDLVLKVRQALDS